MSADSIRGQSGRTVDAGRGNRREEGEAAPRNALLPNTIGADLPAALWSAVRWSAKQY